MNESAKSNLPDISVSDLSAAIKRTMEDTFGLVRVRGEVSGYRGPHSSGHAYFALKDENAKIDAVVWKGVFGRLRFKPEEGMEVVATGKITTFPGSSKYQIVIEALEPAGAGALMMLLDERRKKLAAEGLFDAARKKPLPYLPRVIGIITSPTGAVIRDILHRLSDRFPRDVYLWPVKVQGDGSAEEVAAAIRGFNTLESGGPIPRPDVLIVARGGGSLEDLWSFNEEVVVRAAAESTIPLISAIGHETDTTLIDFAADYRAPTPTAAAERAVPVRQDLISAIGILSLRHAEAMGRHLQQNRVALRALERAMPGPEALIGLKRQHLDHEASRLPLMLRSLISGKSAQFGAAKARLSPLVLRARLSLMQSRLEGTSQRHHGALKHFIERTRMRQQSLTDRFAATRGHYAQAQKQHISLMGERLQVLHQRAQKAMAQLLDRRAERLQQAFKLLAAVSYTNVLNRGFALVTDERGQVADRVTKLNGASLLTIRVADGAVEARTVNDDQRPQAAKRPTKPRAKAIQGDLF